MTSRTTRIPSGHIDIRRRRGATWVDNSRKGNVMSDVPGQGPPTGPPDIDDPCKAPACVNAKATLNSARARFTQICTGLRVVTATIKLLRGFSVMPVWVIVVLILLAILFWFIGLGFLTIVIVALLGFWLLSFYLVIVLGRVALSLGQALAAQAAAVADAAKDVVANCPVQCRGDLSIPVCPL